MTECEVSWARVDSQEALPRWKTGLADLRFNPRIIRIDAKEIM